LKNDEWVETPLAGGYYWRYTSGRTHMILVEYHKPDSLQSMAWKVSRNSEWRTPADFLVGDVFLKAGMPLAAKAWMRQDLEYREE
jgi:hypothetical protein